MRDLGYGCRWTRYDDGNEGFSSNERILNELASSVGSCYFGRAQTDEREGHDEKLVLYPSSLFSRARRVELAADDHVVVTQRHAASS